MIVTNENPNALEFGFWGVTGHRSDKLGGYGDTAQSLVRRFALQILQDSDCETLISGMALGWDQACAWAAVQLGIPLLAAIPFEGQEMKWPLPARRIYHELCNKARNVVIVTPGGYAEWKMQKRNEWIVDLSNAMLALWGGMPGGTANCIDYAHKKDVPVVNLWAWWLIFQGGA